MKKLFLFLIITCLSFGCNNKVGGVDDNADDQDLSPTMRAAFNVLKSAGDMPEVPDTGGGSAIITRCDTSQTVIQDYVDPVTELTYPAREVTREAKYSMTQNTDEFMLINPWTDVIWPGNLIQGKTLGNSNVPSSIPASSKRKPGRVSLSIVAGSDNMEQWWREMPMTNSDVTQSMNDLLRDYLKSTSAGSSPASTSYKIAKVQSYNEMCSKLNLSSEGWGAKLSSSMGKTFSKSNSYCMVTLHQRFFTMTYDDPSFGFKGVFNDDITASDLEPYTGPGNPMCYVSSVSYGRIFILLYESSESSEELHASISASYKGAFGLSFGADDSKKEIFDQTSVSLMQVGGDPVAGLEVAFQSSSDKEDKLKDFIVNGATFSSTNIGAPISFKMNQLYNNNLVKVANMTDYTVENKYYAPVKVSRSVTVNIWDISADPLLMDTKYRDLRKSHLDISDISIKMISKEGEILSHKELAKNRFRDMVSTSGVNKMIYDTWSYSNASEGSMIQISCKGTFKNRANASNNPINFEVAQSYEYSIKDKRWAAISSGSTTYQSRPYEYLCVEGVSDFIKYNFKLHYRLTCDGYSYSYNNDALGM